MKKTYLSLAFLFFSFTSYSQELSVNNLLQALYRPVSETHEMLLNKNWEFYKNTDKQGDKEKSTVWSFVVDQHDKKREVAFCKVNGEGVFRLVVYSFNSETEHDKFVNYFKTPEYQKQPTTFSGNSILDVYTDTYIKYGLYTKGASSEDFKYDLVITTKKK